MATTRTILCREHPGGKFIAPKRRGRPPARCEEAFRCSAFTTAIVDTKKASKRTETQRHAELVEDAKNLKETIEARAAAPRDEVPATSHKVAGNASLKKAKRAKEELTAVGWTVEGKGSGARAEITAIRDAELLVMIWDDGLLVSSHYSLWATDRPRENGMPPSALDFDPNMVSDRELVRMIAGEPVTWWNRLGQCKATAIVSNRQITIQQVYDEKALKHGTEPSERILTFVDLDGGGYKSFRLSSLLKVGN